jgi:hypothetical protein
MKTKEQEGQRQPVSVDEAADLKRREAYFAPPARTRVLGDLAVANRVIKARIGQQTGAQPSEAVKNR